MKKHTVIKVIIILFTASVLLFIGFGLGDWYAHEEYYKEPTHLDCLRLGSDFARKECLYEYNYR